MLDFALSTVIDPKLWDSLDCCVHADFFAESTRSAPVESRRRYQRIPCSGQAIVKRKDKMLGVFTSDISPMGIGFYSPVQLLPKESVKLGFIGYQPLLLEIRRCRRIDTDCYECGAEYAQGPLSAGQYKQLMDSLKS